MRLPRCRRDATLQLGDLQKNGLDGAEALYGIIYSGRNSMPGCAGAGGGGLLSPGALGLPALSRKGPAVHPGRPQLCVVGSIMWPTCNLRSYHLLYWVFTRSRRFGQECAPRVSGQGPGFPVSKQSLSRNSRTPLVTPFILCLRPHPLLCTSPPFTQGACTFGPRLADEDIQQLAAYVLAQAQAGWPTPEQ